MSDGPSEPTETMTEDQAEQRQIALVLSMAMSDHSGERLSIPEFLRQAELAGIPSELRWPSSRITNHLGHGQVARVMTESGQEISQNNFKDTLKKYGLSQGTSEHLARFVSALKGWAAKERQANAREQLATRVPNEIPVAAEADEEIGRQEETRSSRPGGGGSSSRSIPTNDNAIERGLALVQSAVEREVRQLRADHEVQLDRILKIQQERLDDVRSTTAVALDEMKTNFRESLAAKDHVIEVLQKTRSSDRFLIGLLTVLILAFSLLTGAVIQTMKPVADTKPMIVPTVDPAAGGGFPSPSVLEHPTVTPVTGPPAATAAALPASPVQAPSPSPAAPVTPVTSHDQTPTPETHP